MRYTSLQNPQLLLIFALMKELHECPICGTEFEGRSNKIYCSSRCRSERGNGVFRNRHALKIKTNKIFWNNHNILKQMYEWFGSYQLPLFALENAGYNPDENTGVNDRDGIETYEYYIEAGSTLFIIHKKQN